MHGMKAEWEYYKMIGEYKLLIQKRHSESKITWMVTLSTCAPIALLCLVSENGKMLSIFFLTLIALAGIAKNRSERKVEEVCKEYDEAHRSVTGTARRLANVDHGTPIPEDNPEAPMYSDEWYIKETARLKKLVYSYPT